MTNKYSSQIHDGQHMDEHGIDNLAAMAWPNKEVRVQGRELHHIQTEALNRDARLASMDRRDGDVVSGTTPSIHDIDGDDTKLEVRLSAHKIYAQGDVRKLPAQTLIIPKQDLVTIGLRLVRGTITPNDNPNIRGPIPGTSSYGRDGADRITITPTWGYEGDGLTTPLYPVYPVRDGTTQTPSKDIDYSWLDSDRRYDRATNGQRGYVTKGLNVIAQGLAEGKQLFTVKGGEVTVFGHRQERNADIELSIAEEPDLLDVTDESHTFEDAGDGSCTIRLNRGPISSIQDVTIVKEVPVQITRGQGDIDPINLTSVFNITSIVYGATSYDKNVHFEREGDTVKWLTPTRPDVDENYTAVVRHRVKVVPEIIDRFSIKVTGALDETEILVDYKAKLARIDAITINRKGDLHYIKGNSALSEPRQPSTPNDELLLAYIQNDWGQAPTIHDQRILSMSYQQHAANNALQLEILDNQNRLFSLLDILSTEPGKIRHSFIEHARDNNQRDEGLQQTAVITEGAIRLGMRLTEHHIAHGVTMLPFQHVTIAANLRITSSHKINPYRSLARLPAQMTLTPAADLWTDRQTVWATPDVSEIVAGSGDVVANVNLQANIEVVGSTQVRAEFVRVRNISVKLDGFAAGEELEEFSFAGMPIVLPDPVPSADQNGILTFSFDIPPNIPAGKKSVEAIGKAGTPSSGVYPSEGVTTVEELRLAATLSTERTTASVTNITNVTQITNVTNVQNRDPQAQSFATQEARMISGVRWHLSEVGDTDNPIMVQLRGMSEGGQPTARAFAEDIVSGAKLTAGWKDSHFNAPVFNDQGQRRAFAWLTADADHSLSKAVQGELDQNSEPVGGEPFPGGTNFDGADNATWLAHPDRDVSMEILAAEFTQTEMEVDLTTLENITLTGLVVRAGVETPGIGTSLDFIAVEENGTRHILTPNIFKHLGKRIADQNLVIKARLRGSRTISPTLFGDIQVITDDQIDASTYIGRRMSVDANSKIRAVVRAHIPSGASVIAKVGAPDAWQGMTQDGQAVPVGNDFFEYRYTLTGFTDNELRLFLELNGSPAARPTVDSAWVSDLYTGA